MSDGSAGLEMQSRPSPNFDTRKTPIDMLVLHYTGMESGQAALDRLCDADAKVSSHYVVDEDGTIYNLVDEALRAWHAGVASWREREDINSRSIGIEIVNGGHDFGLPEFPEQQIAAVIALCKDILSRHEIADRDIVGHSDIAPARKQDPGERFPWRRLAQSGVGLFPAPVELAQEGRLAASEATAILQAIGYAIAPSDPDALVDGLRAFQRRWRPEQVTGLLDDGTLAMLLAVSRAYAGSAASG